ncbi:MAG: MobF family relaxase, partial [Thermodesulfobacteriota bacterium]
MTITMLSMTNISVGHASAYYTKENYYLQTEAKWEGRGAESLALTGQVEREEFHNLINGRAPDGIELVTAAKGKHRAGVDLTFSAPKSASILSEVAGDIRIREAHEKAVRTALNYAEANFSQARVTRDGVTQRVDTGNLVIAAFPHYVSRELDPQIHSHAVVMNMTLRPDGRWRALSNEELYAHKMLLGQIYRNELGAELSRLGYAIEVTDGRHGLFEEKGVGRELIEDFSQRSGQIKEKVTSLRASGQYPNASQQKLREIATLGSRVAKRDVDMETVRETWKDRLHERVYAIEDMQKNALYEGQKTRSQKAHQRDGIDTAIRGLETMTAVWSRQDMLKEALKIEAGTLRVSDAEKRIEGLLKGRGLVLLENDRYTTREAIRTELSIIDSVEKRRETMSAIDKERTTSLIESKAPYLNEGQRNAVLHVTTSRDGVVGIQGYAGSGKTTMLRVAREIWESGGYTVKAMGFTGKAAEALEREAGIKATTVHGFRADGKAGREVWVIDEASMVGNRQMLEILEKAQENRAKVVLVGDVKQLQPIEAGRAFHVLQERRVLKTAHVTEIMRQKDRLLKEAIRAVTKEDNPGKAAVILKRQGAVKEVVDRQERLMAIAGEYLSVEKDIRSKTIIVTAQNRDRVDINEYVRQGLKERGKLLTKERLHTVSIPKSLSGMDKLQAFNYGIGDEIAFIAGNKTIGVARGEKGLITDTKDNRLTVKIGDRTVSFAPERYQRFRTYERVEREFATGDQVVFLKNDNTLGVRNGTIGAVVGTDNEGLKVETAKGIKEVDLSSYNHVDYGYALTVHKSQGQTVDRVIVNIDTKQERSNNANSFYVAISRARE